MMGAAKRHPRTMLVLGGARSGKSAFAEDTASAIGLERIYIATAEAYDAEMTDRISHHVTRRGAGWRTVEAPRDLDQAIAREAAPDRVLLVDCLTLWLSNVLLADEADRDAPERATTRLCDVIASATGPLILVSNETGLGIVPENALARRFRDCQGRLNQGVAAAVSKVVFVAGGLPLVLKPEPVQDLSL
ncbi:MAG: bifunctional adenosylcobinamide kinase/adenosylcobinamide-phosphate guanylyltransferase [Pseudomonadota bacterium]